MKQLSVFQKGLVADLDFSKLDNNNLVFPTADIRLLNKEGKGLIITPIEGNQKAFEISRGFFIFGAAQYNGISYIISYNPSTEMGEIGSFPSPKQGGGFQEVYKPLQNLYLGDRSDFENRDIHPLPGDLRSIVFNFDLHHPVGDQIVIFPDYDDTVNLIFTDNKNPLRLVNSGFNQKGEYVPERNYWEEELTEAIQLIKPIPKDQKIQFLATQENGNLKHGNYFFFYRYLDRSNNATVFLGESQPISVYSYSNISPNFKVGGQEISGRSVVLNISNLDTSFSFVEFAYIRFFSASGDVTLSEVNRVGKLFSIPPDGRVQAEITGFETIVPFTIASILEPVNTEVICESIISLDRRLWGANWYAEPVETKLLRQAALQIRLGCDDSKTIPRENFQDFYATPENIHYAGYFRGEAYLCKVAFKLKNGYETEAFPVKGIDARKIRPSQVLSSYQSALTNDRGIIILPQQEQSPITRLVLSSGKKVAIANIMAITFDVSQLKIWMQDKQWFKENISEIIFLRAERRPNLMYQGVATSVFGRKMGPYMIGQGEVRNNSASIPIMVGRSLDNASSQTGVPSVRRSISGVTINDAPSQIEFNHSAIFENEAHGFMHFGRRGNSYSVTQSEEEQRIRAVFSPDYIFGDKQKISDENRPWIVPNFRNIEMHEHHAKNQSGVSFIWPNVKFRKFHSGVINRPTTFSYAIQVNRFANVFRPNNWIYPDSPAGLGLVNRARDASRGNAGVINDDFSQSLYYRLAPSNNFVQFSNRNIQTPAYFGFELPDTSRDDISLHPGNSSVNVYSFNPDGDIYYNLYNDELNLQYFKIRYNNIILDEIAHSEPSVLCYQGDAFLQATIIKTRTWFPTNEYGTNDGFNNRSPVGSSISHNGYGYGSMDIFKYAHGELTEIVSENSINTALRIATENENTFFPLVPWVPIIWKGVSWSTGYDDFSLYPFSAKVMGWDTVLGTGIESFQVNHGNSKTISLKGYLSDNPNIPKGENRYPNRIRYTGVQEANFPIIAYRIWPFNARRDFESRYGDIIKLAVLYGRLLSVQRDSIFHHFTNQEEIVASTTGEMVIGVRSILSPQPNVIAEYGSQHKFSIVMGKTGLFGWDWIKGVIWRATPAAGAGVQVSPLDKEKLIETYIKDLGIRVGNAESIYTSNIVRGLNDKTFVLDNKEGIISGYDRYNKEVLLNVFWVDKDRKQRNEILRFSENLDSFIGTSHYPATFFFNIYKDMYVCGLHSGESIYIQNGGVQGRFFEKQYNPEFSFIVNGADPDGGNSLFFIDKHFQAMEIESPKLPFPFEKVKFETMYQLGVNDPLMNTRDFWLTPEYLMSKWAFSINVASQGQEPFYIDSPMIGKWLKVTVVLKSGIDTFVKNITTIFTTTKA